MDYNTIVQQCIREEERYQFPSFTQTDALLLGNLLYQKSIGRDNSVAIEIRMNHLSIFRFFPNGTNANNAEWLQAKANTVDMLQQSSLRFWAEMQISGKTQEEKRMPASGFACCGGGFPLTIRNVGVIGTICVSGLPHMEDHRLIVETLKEYLNK